MNDISGVTANAYSRLSDARLKSASNLVQQPAGSDREKIQRSASEFESILLTSWLESAEKSFATVPGGDGDDENKDPGKNQYQSYAMQAVASALTKAGGIGIASTIVAHLANPAAEESTPTSMALGLSPEK